MPFSKFPTLLLVCAGTLAAPRLRAQTHVHFEARHTHPIGLSPDGTRLFVLNSPEARLSVFDVSNPSNPAPILIAEIPVGLEPVSLRARTNDEVWVVNEVSDSVSIVSVSGHRTIATLRAPDEPADVVFAQGRAFVSCARNNTVRIFDALTHEELPPLEVVGIYPRALAVNASGTRVYGAFLLSGNNTTVLPYTDAPLQPPPANAALPPPPQTALIVPADDPRLTYTVTDHDIVEIDAESLTIVGYTGSTGTNLFDLAVQPGTGDLWAANTEALNLIRFEPALRGHFVDNRLTRVTLPAGTVTAFDLNPGLDYTTLPNPAAQNTALAQPSALSFSADGTHLWVAAFASDRVAKVLADGTVVSSVDLRPAGGSRAMRGPRGLAWQQSTGRLYVMNKLANTVSVIDTAAGTVLTEVPAASHTLLPAAIREGRGFLFDARLSGNGTMSCASCHLDADRDGLAWDLGDPGGEMAIVPGQNLVAGDTTVRDRFMHPMKGPMTTQTLRGLHDGTNAAAPFHWRGDRPTLQSFNATFDDLMGGSPLSVPDIDALALYLETLRHHPNPYEELDRTPPALYGVGDPVRGRNLFTQANNHCSVCHVLPASTNHNIDLMDAVGSTQPVKDPSLALVYQKLSLTPLRGYESLSGFGMLHDGTGFRLPTVHPYLLSSLSNASQFADVRAFLMTLDTGTAPAVGYDLTVTTANRSAENVLSELMVLEDQAIQASCDLAVRGVVQGRPRAFHFVTGNSPPSYRSDHPADPLYDSFALMALLTPGDSLTWLGVPHGQGSRFGADRDGDGILNAGESPPPVSLVPGGNTLTLQWPVEPPDWFPESSPAPAGTWNSLTQPRTLTGNQLSIPLITPVPGGKAFYRLRRTW